MFLLINILEKNISYFEAMAVLDEILMKNPFQGNIGVI